MFKASQLFDTNFSKIEKLPILVEFFKEKKPWILV